MEQDADVLAGKKEIYMKACSAAVSLIDATNTLLQTQNAVTNSINDNNELQVILDLNKVIQNYEQVYMIVNVIRSVQSFVHIESERASLTNAASSASSSAFGVLQYFYDVLSNNPNQAIADLVNNKLYSLMKQNENFNEKKAPKPLPRKTTSVEENCSMQVDQSEPVQSEKPQDYVPSARYIEQTSKEPPSLSYVDEQEAMDVEPSFPPPRERTDLVRQPSEPITVQLSTSKFIEGFENTAREFSAKSNLHMDDFWESMFPIAVPEKYSDWAKANLFGKNLNWETAKSMYIAQFPDNPSMSPQPSSLRSHAQTEMRVVREPVIHSPTPYLNGNRQRMIDFAQRLLSLEMKLSEDIDDYNQKYLRYCIVAQIDLNDSSVQRRYTNSLLPKYRALVTSAVQRPVRGLEEYMKIASAAIRGVEGSTPMTHVKPYNRTCIHGQQQYSEKSSGKRVYSHGGETSPSKRVAY